MKKSNLFILAILMIALFTGCAPATDVSECVDMSDPYGFWGGLWHGWIMFFNLISQIWWDDVTIYAPNNTGGWYDFGFWLGAASFGGGATKASSSRN